MPLGPQDTGMQRAIGVGLWSGNVVLEAARHDRIGAVDDAKCPIAVIHRVDDHPERHDVAQLLPSHVGSLHLAPNGVRRLLPSNDLRVQAAVDDGCAQLLDDPRNEIAPLLPLKFESGDD
jgi:hypothetical protein